MKEFNYYQLQGFFALTNYENISTDTAYQFMLAVPKIRRQAKKHLRSAVIDCNGGDTNSFTYEKVLEPAARRSGDWTEADKFRNDTLAQAEIDGTKAHEALTAIGKEYGLEFAYQGDPRGFTVRLARIKDGNRWKDLGEYGTVQQAINGGF